MKRENGFVKYDSDKVDLTFVEPCVEEMIAEVAAHGEQKYSRDNWKKSFEEPNGALSLESIMEGIHVYNKALQRHAIAMRCSPLEFDPDSGFHHVAHVAWNTMAIRYGIGLLSKIHEEELY
jgi:hypothetical protein